MNYLKLEKKELKPVIEDLNELLANYHLYYQTLRNFHWNISGPQFFELHEKFEALYEQARTHIDEIAERILTLRFKPVSNFSEYLAIATIKEPQSMLTDREMVMNVLRDHEIMIDCMRKVINSADKVEDEGTIDLIAGYLKEIEKESWMLDAYLTEAVGNTMVKSN